MLHNGGVASWIIQDHLGHANIQTTVDLYTHTEPEQQAEAAEIIDAKKRMVVGA